MLTKAELETIRERRDDVLGDMDVHALLDHIDALEEGLRHAQAVLSILGHGGQDALECSLCRAEAEARRLLGEGGDD